MSAKPNISLARWANLGGSFVTDAPSGLRDTGFLDATPAAADIVNGELKQLYLWALYLSDGALSGAHSIDNTLSVAGNLTVTADEILSGAITIGGQPLSFTDFVFTASSSTDLLTDTAHPLHTGAGPVRVSNSGGALPGGLTAGTDYWAIKVDANTFKLATSFANAIANVAIDLTSNGTGTQTLLHQAGTTRATDATVSRNLTVNGKASVGNGLTVSGDTAFNGGLSITEGVHALGTGSFDSGLLTAGSATVTGALGVSGAATIGGALSIAGEITPPTITSTTAINDWNPSGLSSATVIRQVVTNSGGGNVSITGIVAPASTGKILVLHALGTLSGDTITLQHENAGSTASNRFSFASGSNLVIPQQGTVMLRYDFTSSRWRSIAKNF